VHKKHPAAGQVNEAQELRRRIFSFVGQWIDTHLSVEFWTPPAVAAQEGADRGGVRQVRSCNPPPPVGSFGRAARTVSQTSSFPRRWWSEITGSTVACDLQLSDRVALPGWRCCSTRSPRSSSGTVSRSYGATARQVTHISYRWSSSPVLPSTTSAPFCILPSISLQYSTRGVQTD
jgi:hypothetical protein